jgi:hypothetical protein
MIGKASANPFVQLRQLLFQCNRPSGRIRFPVLDVDDFRRSVFIGVVLQLSFDM